MGTFMYKFYLFFDRCKNFFHSGLVTYEYLGMKLFNWLVYTHFKLTWSKKIFDTAVKKEVTSRSLYYICKMKLVWFVKTYKNITTYTVIIKPIWQCGWSIKIALTVFTHVTTNLMRVTPAAMCVLEREVHVSEFIRRV